MLLKCITIMHYPNQYRFNFNMNTKCQDHWSIQKYPRQNVRYTNAMKKKWMEIFNSFLCMPESTFGYFIWNIMIFMTVILYASSFAMVPIIRQVLLCLLS